MLSALSEILNFQKGMRNNKVYHGDEDIIKSGATDDVIDLNHEANPERMRREAIFDLAMSPETMVAMTEVEMAPAEDAKKQEEALDNADIMEPK